LFDGGKRDATEAGQVAGGYFIEHPDRSCGRETSETGGRYRRIERAQNGSHGRQVRHARHETQMLKRPDWCWVAAVLILSAAACCASFMAGMLHGAALAMRTAAETQGVTWTPR